MLPMQPRGRSLSLPAASVPALRVQRPWRSAWQPRRLWLQGQGCGCCGGDAAQGGEAGGRGVCRIAQSGAPSLRLAVARAPSRSSRALSDRAGVPRPRRQVAATHARQLPRLEPSDEGEAPGAGTLGCGPLRRRGLRRGSVCLGGPLRRRSAGGGGVHHQQAHGEACLGGNRDEARRRLARPARHSAAAPR